MPIKYRNRVKDNKRLHGIYHGIKKRCYNENSKRYKDYGGRGIAMCDEWLNSEIGFDNFCDWAKSHGYQDNLTIERKDVNGNYCPENCIWITIMSQARNKRDTIRVIYRGEEKPLIEWCEILGLRYDTIHERIMNFGWDAEKAFETPSQLETSFAKICRNHGISPSVVKDRITKLGWSYEDAINIPDTGYFRSDEMCEKRYGYGECLVCGKKFLKHTKNRKYCGDKCRDYYKRHKTEFEKRLEVI